MCQPYLIEKYSRNLDSMKEQKSRELQQWQAIFFIKARKDRNCKQRENTEGL